MTALLKPTSTPTKTLPVKAKTTPKIPSLKTAPIKTKPPVAAKTKILANTTIKPAAKTLTTTQVKTRTPAAKVLATKLEDKTLKVLKPKKVKLVRDSFTIPKPEYLVLDDLKLRAAELKHPVKKSELLRAGIKALAAMTAAQFQSALQAVPALKTGRPSK